MTTSGRRPTRQGADSSGGGRKAGEKRPQRSEEPEPEADPASVATSLCLRLLTDRARSRAELAAAMTRKLVPAEVQEAVLDRLVELGFLDDQAFAESWVQSRHTGRGLARRALAHELRAKGVDPEIVAGAVEVLDDQQEAARAAELVRRRLRASRGLPAETRARRLVGMLARKGYSGAVASRVVREALAVEHAEDDIDAAGAWMGLGSEGDEL